MKNKPIFLYLSLAILFIYVMMFFIPSEMLPNKLPSIVVIQIAIFSPVLLGIILLIHLLITKVKKLGWITLIYIYIMLQFFFLIIYEMGEAEQARLQNEKERMELEEGQ